MQTVIKRSLLGEPRPQSGALQLRVAGFSQQDVVGTAHIVAAIDVLPAFHLAGLREIVYAPALAPGFGGRTPHAEFIQRQRRIVFYDIGDKALFDHVLYHEIGHFVFFLALHSSVKKDWVTRIFPHSDCMTVYGARNASEDFAETYACYVRQPENLLALPEKYAFMRDVVFSGHPGTMKDKAPAGHDGTGTAVKRVLFDA